MIISFTVLSSLALLWCGAQLAARKYISSLKTTDSLFAYGDDTAAKTIIQNRFFSRFAVDTLLDAYDEQGPIVEGDMDLTLQYKAEILSTLAEMGPAAAVAAPFLLTKFNSRCPWVKNCLDVFSAIGTPAQSSNKTLIQLYLDKKLHGIFAEDLGKVLRAIDPSGETTIDLIVDRIDQNTTQEGIETLLRLLQGYSISNDRLNNKLQELISSDNWQLVELSRKTLSSLTPVNGNSEHVISFEHSLELQESVKKPSVSEVVEKYAKQIDLLRAWAKELTLGKLPDTSELDESLPMFRLDEITSAEISLGSVTTIIKSRSTANTGYGCSSPYSEDKNSLIRVAFCQSSNRDHLLLSGYSNGQSKDEGKFQMLIDFEKYAESYLNRGKR